MVKKTILPLLFTVISLMGCNEKPEVNPENHRNLSVYPNPTSRLATATVQLPEFTAYTLKIFDAKGKIFFEETVPSGTSFNRSYPINLQDQPAGKYQVVLETGNTVTWQTLIKTD